MNSRRTPVWLLTGYLGSGKTTLLRQWLREPALADAALVVNEIGEVGFDDRLLASAVDSARLLANSCICCSGLPGLEEALTELWWDRLQRRRPAFSSVVIETTGLADPGPVIAAFETTPFLRERYQLAGVLACASASAGTALLAAQREARAQIEAADAVILTKTDQASALALQAEVRRLNPRAQMALSAQASLTWMQLRALLQDDRPMAPVAAAHAHAHHHAAAAAFIALPEPLASAALQARVADLRGPDLLRLKGVVALTGGALHTVQWALGDADLNLTPFVGTAPALGLTCIRAQGATAPA
ncbi:MAG: GTP-binding protein [Burkholderiales bacterium]|nr:GTP-binding protein [Burkholderiales bacterium]